MLLNENAITLLGKITNVDLNPGSTPAYTDIFTVPEGKKCIVAFIFYKNASAAWTTASTSVGWNVTADDVEGDEMHTELNDSTRYTALVPQGGVGGAAVIGNAGDLLKFGVNTAEGSALTVDIDIFGYFY